MSACRSRPFRARSQGFTLLEMMAVVLMMGMLLAFALPNLGVTDTAILRSEARQVAAQLEYARQRAVMTGHPHRALIGLGDGWYQIEWFVSDSEDPSVVPLPGSEGAAPGGAPGRPRETVINASSPVAMSPSQEELPSYRPVPGRPGEVGYLDEDVDFAGAQTAEGWYDHGEFQIVFDQDGTTDAVDLVLRSGDAPGFVLQVSPVIDLVRILDEQG